MLFIVSNSVHRRAFDNIDNSKSSNNNDNNINNNSYRRKY